MQSVAREVKSVQQKFTKRLSVKEPREDTRVLDIRPGNLSPTPVNQGGFSSSFFSERTLTFLGIIASIIALSLSLWALHKNSDMSRRVSDLNMSVVDLIVESKSTPVTEQSRGTSVGKTIKDKLEAKRLKRQQSRQLPPEKTESITVPTQSIVPPLPMIDVSSMNAQFLATKAEMERQNMKVFEDSNRRIEDMKKRRIDKNDLKEQMNQKPVIQSPQFPSGFLREPMNKAKMMIDQMNAVTSSSNDAPLIPEISKEDIDLDDLERDLKLLELGK